MMAGLGINLDVGRSGKSQDFLPDADITFDKFHVMKKVNEAVSDVRREEAKHQDILTKTRYLWLKNRDKLTKKQETTLNDILALRNMNLKTVRAYKIKLAFQELFSACGLNKKPNVFRLKI